ncbi:MAG: alpha/beta fold hydrolase [Bacteroidota bacterium]
MKNKEIIIEAVNEDMSRPKERPKKKTWKTEITKTFLQVYQYVAPKRVAEIIWGHFTKPVSARFTPHQMEIMEAAHQEKITYKGFQLVTYRWGSGSKRVLLSHGWNSKIADFRRMIKHFVQEGYEVHGVDMKAHGQSEGIRSALPEFRDVLKSYIQEEGKFDAIVGYSLGGIAAGIAINELPKTLRPEQFFVIATPPYTRYFFESVVKNDAGCNHRVYEYLSDMVEEHYKESIDYFDLRLKHDALNHLDLHLIYDEQDKTVPFSKGEEMKATFPNASWVHTKGLGHYKVIAYHQVIEYISNSMSTKDLIAS